jgi:hypothetical protein
LPFIDKVAVTLTFCKGGMVGAAGLELATPCSQTNFGRLDHSGMVGRGRSFYHINPCVERFAPHYLSDRNRPKPTKTGAQTGHGRGTKTGHRMALDC